VEEERRLGEKEGVNFSLGVEQLYKKQTTKKKRVIRK
jgi:hypothetical protein